jgi:hypothetical protein
LAEDGEREGIWRRAGRRDLQGMSTALGKDPLKTSQVVPTSLVFYIGKESIPNILSTAAIKHFTPLTPSTLKPAGIPTLSHRQGCYPDFELATKRTLYAGHIRFLSGSSAGL